MVFITKPQMLHGKAYSYKGFPKWLQSLEKGNHNKNVFLGVTATFAVSYVISQLMLCTNTLPETMTADNEAKHVAWMKFNNVNPIFGVSRNN